MNISLCINGQSREFDAEPRTLLVHLLRDEAGLTGTHIACETSICGACTVLLDGKAVKSCTVLAVQAEGAEGTTIGGLARARLAWRVHPFLAEVKDPARIRLDWEHVEMRWVSPGEMPSPETVPGLGEALRRVIGP